ncbi:ATP-dependent RNA helicase HrpA [Aliidiomarina maris]|uniref:ATP-dependent RNA helicase HrpA n=1 Tax=Aliidiomarina maris TaxID=531312 RepID=A0A327X0M8_9GAMM|nr:ATP-dependent RNA helicase HrpA [Aliidiomarina maris]RAJ98844.1 ATP-dependent helicase HrpA [Aliidiomarina maris]RUO24990.1 ATP-dependent RNA helicase HrpA [Aliidiomarina maris]
MNASIQALAQAIPLCRSADRFKLSQQLKRLKQLSGEQRDQAEQQLTHAIQASIQQVATRTAALPKISFPESLPVVAHQSGIRDAIANHQVVIVAGETGSGKTTQLPKILLSMGYGAKGIIAHTQPRRLAARSVATRIAEELGQSVGASVGYKVRFQDTSSDQGSVKLMTDGVLLAELQNDRYLSQYEVIIIDEAHERSLNIDFLLGVMHQLLPKRPDLKLIITSATIETERFSKHFNDAPVISVEGRTFPVETWYRPLNDSDDQDMYQGIVAACAELIAYGPGDILVFLSGEREIRDSADALNDAYRAGELGRQTGLEVVPLFARLSASEQNRIFQPHAGRRIVLATNVAETSLTVPGIRYVVDPGFARLSRYSYRTKVQRLPIEPVSQASANQRQGRCGRVGPGVCIRLYSEDDFLSRPDYTDPEILRTNLASVILQMTSLRLGDIRQFPFLQRPDERFVNDGLSLLEELHAIHSRRQRELRLTDSGRMLARLPIDPRLARMVLAARDTSAVRELMIITAALSIQDPRERPADAKQKSDEKHARFHHPQSDFMAYLSLWDYLQAQQKSLSNSQFRKLCKQEYIHYLRVREWQDLYTQLRQTVRELKLPINDEPASLEQVHQALLAGLLSHIGMKDEGHEFHGARGRKFYVFPGSGLFKKPPKWLMASELVETSRLFARTVGMIKPEWVEPLAKHLVKRSHSEPHFEKKRGAVVAFEQVSLYGVVIVPKRKVQYGPIDAVVAREIYIREALVNGQISEHSAKPLGFIAKNLATIEQIQALEDKSRRRDILVDEEALFTCYEQVLPADIYDDRSLARWYRQAQRRSPDILVFTREQLMLQEASFVTEQSYPDEWRQGSLSLPLSYQFDPNAEDDGVSVELPVGILNQVQDDGFDWLIPALREELVVALIKSLPKRLRRNFVPAPNYAQAALQAMQVGEGSLLDGLSRVLKRMSGVSLTTEDWDLSTLPVHLRMNFKVFDNDGNLLAQGRDLKALQHQLQGQVKATLVATAGDSIEQQGLTQWSFGELPQSIEKHQGRFAIRAYPALRDTKDSVAIELFDNPERAAMAHQQGLRRLVLLNVPSPLKYLRENLPNKSKLAMYFNPWGRVEALIEDCIDAAIDALLASMQVNDEASFKQALDTIRAELNTVTLDIAKAVERCLVLSHGLQKNLKGKIPFDQVQSYADIKAHLNTLVFKGFVSEFGRGRLADIERYLKALQQRQEKLAVDPNRDRLRMLTIEKLESQWQAKLKQVPKGDSPSEALLNFRWMLEELRVSLFAQQLGTAYPVSEQRLQQALAAL